MFRKMMLPIIGIALAGAIALSFAACDGNGDTTTTYAVTVNGGTGGGNYAQGATVTITATVPSGQQFVNWTVNSGSVALSPNNSTSPATFTMPGNAVTVTANFEPIPLTPQQIADAFKTAHSAILAETTATVGLEDEAAVTAALDAFTALASNVQALLGTEKTLLDNLKTKIEELKSQATPQQLADAFKAGHSAILAKSVDTVTVGDEAAVTAALDAYNALASNVQALLGTEKTLLDNLKTKIDDLKANTTYLVTVNGGTGGGNFAQGVTVTITAEPPSGQQFVNWTINAGGITLAPNNSTSPATFIMPPNAVTVTANFEPIPQNTYTVTFNSNGGSPVQQQHIVSGGKAEEPQTPAKAAAAGLYLGELTVAETIPAFVEWRKPDNTAWDFNTDTVTADITLTAHWDKAPITITGNNAATVFNNTFTYINNNPAAYTLLIGEDIAVAGNTTRGLTASNAKLTIIGIDTERKISLNSQGRIFTVGASGQTGIAMTLGNNITLVGRTNGQNGANSNNNNNVVDIFSAAFTMLEGSKITGNTGSLRSAVQVWNGGSFTMYGGTITGNHCLTNSSGDTGGLLARSNGTTVTLAGGSIIGNTSVFTFDNSALPGDVFINQLIDTFTLSGSATVGELCLAVASGIRSSPTIDEGWTGNITSISLHGANTPIGTTSISISQVITAWSNRSILQGSGVNATTVGQIGLGVFIAPRTNASNSYVTPQDINDTHKLNETGVLVEKE